MTPLWAPATHSKSTIRYLSIKVTLYVTELAYVDVHCSLLLLLLYSYSIFPRDKILVFKIAQLHVLTVNSPSKNLPCMLTNKSPFTFHVIPLCLFTNPFINAHEQCISPIVQPLHRWETLNVTPRNSIYLSQMCHFSQQYEFVIRLPLAAGCLRTLLDVFAVLNQSLHRYTTKHAREWLYHAVNSSQMCAEIRRSCLAFVAVRTVIWMNPAMLVDMEGNALITLCCVATLRTPVLLH